MLEVSFFIYLALKIKKKKTYENNYHIIKRML